MERNPSSSPAATNLEVKTQPVGPRESPVAAAAAAETLTVPSYRPFRKWVSWVVPSFVAANIVVFAVTMSVNDCPKNSASCVARFLGRFSFQPLKENPLLGPSSSTLEIMGALEVSKVVKEHQWWRLISCIWLHAGVFHLLANMFSLLFIGIRLEQEFGFVRIGLLYVLSGFGGSLLSSLFIQNGISVGASGALFGLLGSMLSELLTNWTIYANKKAALTTLILIIAINLAVGVLPHVDNFAHIGGFFSGFLLGFIFLIRPQFRWISQKYSSQDSTLNKVHKHKTYQRALWILSMILLLVGYILGLIMLLRGVNLNNHCSWCHFLSCVPTSHWSCSSRQVYCDMIQTGNQLNMTCQGHARSSVFQLPNSNPSQLQLQDYCRQVCN